MVELLLLGTPRVLRDGRAVAFDTRKALALLAYLAVTERAHPRDALVELFWPGRDVEHGRGALRRTLTSVRGAVGAERLEATRDRVLLVPGADVDVDVLRFRALTRAGRAAEAVAVGADGIAAGFMAGFVVRDAVAYEEWQDAEADALRRELGTVLARVSAESEAAGDLPGALRSARRWLALDDLHEPAHQAVIRLTARTGDRAGALVGYRECVRTLSRELGVTPLRETTLLYETISRGDLDPVPAPAGPDPVGPVLPPLPLLGRSAEVDALRAAYRRSATNGRAVLIEGEPGIGKTRLADELVANVRAAGGRVLVGRAFAEESGLAYAPVVDLLRARLAEDTDWLAALPDTARHELARLLPELRRGGLEPSDDAGAALRFLAGVWQALAAALDGPAPGVLVVDDAQWADGSTLDLLAYGVRRLPSRPLLLVLTWRSAPDHAVRGVLAEAVRTGHASVLRPGRLGAADVTRAVAGLGESADLAHRMLRETEGLPFLLVEYRNALATDPQAPWTLPAGARELLRGRLEPVGETARQVLAAAAVVGRSFDVDTVRAVSGRGEEETVAAVEELTVRRLVREGARDYDFSHEQLRSLVYDETSLARRRLLHTRAAALPQPAAAAARHLRLAGRDDEAAAAYVRAAEQARTVFAHAEAAQHLRSALALGPADPAAVHTALGEVLTVQGDYAGALAGLQAAAALLSGTALADVEHRIGQVYHRRGDWDLAEAHVRAALTGVAEDDHLRQARMRLDLGLTAEAAGRAGAAATLAADARARAERSGDARTVAQAENLLGLLATSGGQLSDAVRHLEASLALARASRDAYAEVAALNNLALAQRAGGHPDEAETATRAALEVAGRLGDRHREAALHNNLADLLHAAGRGEEAMTHLKQAVALFAQVGGADEPLPEVWKLVRW